MIDTPPVDSDDAATIAFQVVDRLVDEWGVREDTDQVTVWFRIHIAALTRHDHR